MPDRRLRLMALHLGTFFLAVVALNWVANPYGAWRAPIIDKIYLRMDRGTERVTSPYRVRAEHPSTLLVGSSRVLYGMPIEQGFRDGVLNAALSGARLQEIADIIRLASETRALKRVIWGVDFYAFHENSEGFADVPTQLRLGGDPRLLISETLLSMEALDASRRVFLRAIGGRKRLPFMRVVALPWPEEVIRETLADSAQISSDRARPLDFSLPSWLEVYADYRLSTKQIALFRDTVSRARAAGAEVILFLPPLSEYELEAIRQSGQWDTFQRWKRQLLTVGAYWDFSGYNYLARSDDLFVDLPHFAPGVGHTILRHLMGEGCAGCGPIAQRILADGVWVDNATVDQQLARQEATRAERARSETEYSRAVAALRHR